MSKNKIIFASLLNSKPFSWLAGQMLPTILAFVLLFAGLAIYIISSLLNLSILGIDTKSLGGSILLGLLFIIAIVVFFVYVKLINVDKYENLIKTKGEIDTSKSIIIPVIITAEWRQNLEGAQKVMNLAKKELLSLSVLSSPAPRNDLITEEDDTAASVVYNKMTNKLSDIDDDFKFLRIISLQDKDESLFFNYLNQQMSRSDWTKGSFYFRIYNIPKMKDINKTVRFPNIIVADSKYVFISLRQQDKKSRGIIINDSSIASMFASYFYYLWDEFCEEPYNNRR
jgi:hypothetical protein